MQFCGIVEDSHGQQNCKKRHKYRPKSLAVSHCSRTFNFCPSLYSICEEKLHWSQTNIPSLGLSNNLEAFLWVRAETADFSFNSEQERSTQIPFDVLNNQVISNQTTQNLKWKLIFLLHNYLLKHIAFHCESCFSIEFHVVFIFW